MKKGLEQMGEELEKREVEEFIQRFKKAFPQFSSGNPAAILDATQTMTLIVRVMLFREGERQ